jgi:tetratricopeptide (TPR) repeat protein
MDPYAPCPCGSGKKVKFCCQKLLPEMERIERLQENQPETALALLNKLEQTHGGNPWVVTTKAGTLMQQGEFASAKIALLKFLREHPDHPRANALYAFASFHADGFPACKKAVHRAFKRCVTESPRICCALMEALGEYHYMQANLMAARAHLVLAARLAATPEDGERIIRGIIRFDSDSRIPYLLRGGHHIPSYEPPDAAREAFERARRLSLLACWEEAADLLEEIAETQDSSSAPLWHMLGLFRAWDGDEEAAAEALHRAATFYGQGPTAVECETIAQFLDHSRSDRVVPMRMLRYTVSSVSQLLSRLDDEPHFVRSDESTSVESEDSETQPVAVYLVLDRPLPPRREYPSLTPESVPLYLGRVLVFDGVPDDNLPATAYLTGLEGEQLWAAEAAFTTAASGLVERIRPPLADETAAEDAAEIPQAEAAAANPTDAELEVIGEIFEEELPMHRNYFVPPGTPGDVRAAIVDDHWRRVLEDIWPATPQQALQGKSPREAAQDPQLRTPLEAALHLLEAFCEERGDMLPVREMRERLGLPPVEPYPVDPDVEMSKLSAFDLERLDLAALSDVQLDELLNRLRISPHLRLLYETLREWLQRHSQADANGKAVLPDQDRNLALLTSLASDARRPQEALEWITRGLETARQFEGHTFEAELLWKMRELRVRTMYSPLADVRALLLELWERFGVKLPNLRSQLVALARSLDIDPPWESTIVTAEAGWTPAAAAVGPEPAKKLWLPGQD